MYPKVSHLTSPNPKSYLEFQIQHCASTRRRKRKYRSALQFVLHLHKASDIFRWLRISSLFLWPQSLTSFRDGLPYQREEADCKKGLQSNLQNTEDL